MRISRNKSLIVAKYSSALKFSIAKNLETPGNTEYSKWLPMLRNKGSRDLRRIIEDVPSRRLSLLKGCCVSRYDQFVEFMPHVLGCPVCINRRRLYVCMRSRRGSRSKSDQVQRMYFSQRHAPILKPRTASACVFAVLSSANLFVAQFM